MKLLFKIALTAFFVVSISLSSNAQGYLEGGFKAGVWLNTGDLNSIIREYNDANPWQKFHTVHGGKGGRIVFGAEMESWTFFVGLKWMRNVQTSSGIDPSTNAMDYKRLIVHYGGICMGMNTKTINNKCFGFETNAFNYFVIRTQHATQPVFKLGHEYSEKEIVNRVNPEISFFLRFSKWLGITGFTLTPAIDLPVILGKNDISGLRKEWKLYTPSTDKTMRGINASITLSLLLGRNRD